MKHGRFLSNTADPKDPKARMYHVGSFYAFMSGKAARDEEWRHHMDWINANIICPPKATKRYTQKQLIKMGMVGLYAPAKK